MKNSLLKNSTIYAVGQFLPKAISFLMLPLMTRYLTKGDYGIVASVTAITSVLAIVASLQINNALRRCYFDYQSEIEKKQFVGTITLSVFALNISMFALCMIGHSLLQLLFPAVPFFPFYFIGIAQVSLLSIFNLFQILYQTAEKPISYVVMSLVVFVVNITLLIIFVVVFQMGALGMMLASLVTYGITLPIAIWVARKWFILTWQYAMFQNALAFGVRLIPYALSSMVLANADRFLIARYTSTDELGLYGVALRLAMVVFMVDQALMAPYVPFFFRTASTENEDYAKRYLGSISTQVILFEIVIVIGFILFMDDIVTIMLDKKFFAVAAIAPYLIAANFFSSVAAIIGLGANYVKKHIWFAWIVIAGGLINIMLNIMLIPKYGAIGAAMATMASAGVMMLLRLVCSQYYWPVQLGYRYFLETVTALAVKGFLFGAFFLFVFLRNGWLSKFTGKFRQFNKSAEL